MIFNQVSELCKYYHNPVLEYIPSPHKRSCVWLIFKIFIFFCFLCYYLSINVPRVWWDQAGWNKIKALYSLSFVWLTLERIFFKYFSLVRLSPYWSKFKLFTQKNFKTCILFGLLLHHHVLIVFRILKKNYTLVKSDLEIKWPLIWKKVLDPWEQKKCLIPRP